MTKKEKFEEVTNSLKDVEATIKEFEKKNIIKIYKELLLKKEYLLCEYTFLSINNDKKSR